MLCQASSTRSRSVPGSVTVGSEAVNSRPSFVGFLKVTVPTGFLVSWYSSSGLPGFL